MTKTPDEILAPGNRRSKNIIHAALASWINAAVVVLDLAEIRKPRQFGCHQSASLRVADLELHRQRLRAADHDIEGDCQPSDRTRAKCRGLVRARAQLR